MRQSLPWLALLCSVSLYGLHFFAGGGRSHLILDSFAYLQLSSGEQTSVPFSTRVMEPLVASLIASATGLSPSTAFKLLTPAALLTSLILLGGIIRRRGGSPEWQAAVLIAFGCSLAVTFGYTPVVVDPGLLLLTCLSIAVLDTGHLLIALSLACLAALTKEFGLVLGVVWFLNAYRRGLRTSAFIGLSLPAAALLVLLLARQSTSGLGFGNWPTYISHTLLEYQLSVFRLRGPVKYAELLYMWSWCTLWPAMLVSAATLLPRRRKRAELTEDEVVFAVLLLTLPILLLGDWSRSLIILVPFACIVATAHPLARQRRFVILLAIGGLSTALARPFHGETPAPHFWVLSMTAISVVSSLLISVIIVRFAHTGRAPELDSEVSGSDSEVAVQ